MPYAKEKSPDFYRRLADQCRETARMVSAEGERVDLLARAKIWDFLADAEQYRAEEEKKKEAEEIERACKDMIKRTSREQPA